jgi:hypothetical protein
MDKKGKIKPAAGSKATSANIEERLSLARKKPTCTRLCALCEKDGAKCDSLAASRTCPELRECQENFDHCPRLKKSTCVENTGNGRK